MIKLSNNDLLVLKLINDKTSIQDIAKIKKTSRTAVYKSINRMVKKKLLEKGNNKGCIHYNNQAKFFMTQWGREKLRNNGLKKEFNRKGEFCEVCGFNLIVNRHHIDGNRKNNHNSNLIYLCPNHHFLIHRGLAFLNKYDNNIYYIMRLDNFKEKLQLLKEKSNNKFELLEDGKIIIDDIIKDTTKNV